MMIFLMIQKCKNTSHSQKIFLINIAKIVGTTHINFQNKNKRAYEPNQ